LGQEAVFEVRAVVNAGRQQDHVRVPVAARRQAAQYLNQFQRILVDRQDLARLENLRKRPRHDQPVLEHVGHAARCPDVVFQHQIIAGLGVAHQVDSGNVGVDASRHLDARHLPLVVLAGKHQRTRNLAVLEDALRAIDVLQEQIQRHDALRKTGLQSIPLRARDHTRDKVKRKKPLGSPAVTVHGERDALKQERKIRQPPALFEFGGAQSCQRAEDLFVVRSRVAGRAEHLVVIDPEFVPRKEVLPGRGLLVLEH
jgi:hypothetical protein